MSTGNSSVGSNSLKHHGSISKDVMRLTIGWLTPNALRWLAGLQVWSPRGDHGVAPIWEFRICAEFEKLSVNDFPFTLFIVLNSTFRWKASPTAVGDHQLMYTSLTLGPSDMIGSFMVRSPGNRCRRAGEDSFAYSRASSSCLGVIQMTLRDARFYLSLCLLSDFLRIS